MFTNDTLENAFHLDAINLNDLIFKSEKDLFSYFDYLGVNPGIDTSKINVEQRIFYYSYRSEGYREFEMPSKYLSLNLKEYLFLNLNISKIAELEGKIEKFKKVKIGIRAIAFLNSSGSNFIDYYKLVKNNEDKFEPEFVQEFYRHFVCYMSCKDFKELSEKTYSQMFDTYWVNAQRVCDREYNNPMIYATNSGRDEIIDYLIEQKKAKVVYESADNDIADDEKQKKAFSLIRFEEMSPLYKISYANTLDKFLSLGLVPDLRGALEAWPDEFFGPFIKTQVGRKSSIDEIFIVLKKHGFDFKAPFNNKRDAKKSGDFIEDYIKKTYQPEQYSNIKERLQAIEEKDALEKSVGPAAQSVNSSAILKL